MSETSPSVAPLTPRPASTVRLGRPSAGPAGARTPASAAEREPGAYPSRVLLDPPGGLKLPSGPAARAPRARTPAGPRARAPAQALA
ncbi:hypothetical protein [Streptomyces sp. NPDC004267]|uniref:hypothetical protein n=1 Tax=Streptomyces sp. NPDC004267 TaxID=3364694 RepID=UPI0036C2CB79